jgi:LacI family transcriptional regulator
MKVAQELGWKPDAELARQMALVRQSLIKTDSPHIALVINKSTAELKEEPSPRLHLLGARDYAERMGYIADIFNLADAPLSPRRLRNILVARGIQGIVFIGSAYPQLPEEFLEIGHDFACVVAGVRYPNLPFHIVYNDFLGAGRICIQKILESGYRRPGIILPLGVDAPLGFGMSGGYSTGLIEVDEENRLPILHVGSGESHIPEYEYERVKAWIRAHQPDSLVTTDTWHGEAIRDAIAESGPYFPLFSGDWFPGQPVKGGIHMRQRRVGEAAVDVVVAQLHRGQSGLPEVPYSVHIGAVWMDGNAAPAGRLVNEPQ